MQAIGNVRGAQCIELELKIEKRRLRSFVQTSPAVADAFNRLQDAAREERAAYTRRLAELTDRKRAAAKAFEDSKAATAQLRETHEKIREMETVSACRH